jgi:hypothetical protein
LLPKKNQFLFGIDIDMQLPFGNNEFVPNWQPLEILDSDKQPKPVQRGRRPTLGNTTRTVRARTGDITGNIGDTAAACRLIEMRELQVQPLSLQQNLDHQQQDPPFHQGSA